MDMKLEVFRIPVRDVDAAKDFYARQVGFHLDHDARPSQGMRVVQLTPPGSACSKVIGEPGSRFCFFEDLDGNMWAVQQYKRANCR
jgi:hypothetical protein